MNKHGQTLILFVILIPIIIMLLAVVVDVGLITTKKIKLEEITKDAIKTAFNSDDKILELLKKNDIDINKVKIDRKDGKLKIEIKEEIKSIFGGIVGIKEYNVVVRLTGYMENDKVVLE